MHAVCAIDPTVVRLLVPIDNDNAFRVRAKAMRRVGATQPVSRLTSISTHTMSPSTHTHCPQNPDIRLS